MLTIRRIDADGAVLVEHQDVALALADATGIGSFLWVDIAAPIEDEAGTLDRLGLPPLLVEDMRDDLHLPKVEVLQNTLSLTVHGLDVTSMADELRTVELDCAMRADLLVTYHVEPLASVHAVGDRLDAGNLGFGRPMLLLHRLLDVMNDVFVPFVDHLDRRLDVIEEDILDEPTEQTRRDLFSLQRDVIQLRRVVVPQAEVIRRLGRERPAGWQEGDESLVRDLYDHLNRMVALSDSYHQLLESAMASYRSALDDQQNEMLTALTVVSSVLLPVSVLAGLWGTNFARLPGSGEEDGFSVLLVVSGAIVVLMLSWFWRRGWIGGRAERAGRRRRRSLGSALDVPVLGAVLRVPVVGGRAVGRAVGRAAGRE